MANSYNLKEVYFTVQGEGRHVFREAVFCRFTGCNLWSGREADRKTATCSFCDTDFVGTDGPGGGTFGDPASLAKHVRAIWDDQASATSTPYVVCTGGEPLLQLDSACCDALHEQGMQVAIETNGTRELPVGLDYICVSPKTGEHTLKVSDAQEVKYVRNAGQGIPKPTIKAERRYLSPAFHPDGTVDRSSLQHCIELCKLFPSWRLSCQQHKWWRVR